jgi:uncharacterized membrane protein YdbT with pleckstrin-like domain
MTPPVDTLAESVVWSGHRSHWHYFGYWSLGLLLAPFVVGFGIIWWIFLDRGRRTYLVTPQRVIIEWGYFSKSSRELRAKDIRSIEIRKSGLLGLFDVGNLEFSSAASDEAEVVFQSVPHANRVRDLVRAYQDT